MKQLNDAYTYESKDFHLSFSVHYGSLAQETRLKIAVNMTNLTCLGAVIKQIFMYLLDVYLSKCLSMFLL